MNNFKKIVWSIIDSLSSDLEIENSLKNLSKLNNFSSMAFLSCYYDLIDNEEKSKNYLNKLNIKDIKNNEDDLYAQALLYLNGIFYKENEEKAIELLKLSSDAGSYLADIELANQFMEKGSKKDLNIAIDYLNKAYEKGLTEALLTLSDIYVELSDIKNARKYLKLAIEKNLDGHLGLALIELDFENKKSAIKHLNKSYEFRKNKENTFELAEIFYDTDFNKSFKLYEESSKLGNPEASMALALEYYVGDKLEYNEEKAYNYLTKAYNKANLDAVFYLGLFYLQGIYVEKNIETAKNLLETAAYYGNEEAKEVLESLV